MNERQEGQRERVGGRERQLLRDHSVFFSIIDWPQLNGSATGLDWLVIRKHSAGHSFLMRPHVVRLQFVSCLPVARPTRRRGSHLTSLSDPDDQTAVNVRADDMRPTRCCVEPLGL